MVTIDTISVVLRQPLPGSTAHQLMAPQPRATGSFTGNSDLRRASVLLMLYMRTEQLCFCLIRRAVTANRRDRHSGQMAFPGGKQEAGEPLVATALRETEEEIGVPANSISLLGKLSSIDTYSSNYRVYPFVGHCIDSPVFTPSAAEVAYIVEVPVSRLLASSAQRVEYEMHPGIGRRTIPYFEFCNHKVWGVTAMILAEFMQLLLTYQDRRHVA